MIMFSACPVLWASQEGACLPFLTVFYTKLNLTVQCCLCLMYILHRNFVHVNYRLLHWSASEFSVLKRWYVRHFNNHLGAL